MTNKEILNLEVMSNDFDGTIGEYLKELLYRLWRDGECFSGKRPFGNSGWEYDLIHPLVVAGLVPGEIIYYEDEDYTEVECKDFKTGYKIISDLIKELQFN